MQSDLLIASRRKLLVGNSSELSIRSAQGEKRPKGCPRTVHTGRCRSIAPAAPRLFLSFVCVRVLISSITQGNNSDETRGLHEGLC